MSVVLFSPPMRVFPNSCVCARVCSATSPLPSRDMAEKDAAEAIENPGYHYWHGSVAQTDGAAPKEEPKLLAKEVVQSRGAPVNIDSFGLLDDDDKVKVYVTLEGDMAGITNDDVNATFNKMIAGDDCSMDVLVRGAKQDHRLAADKLSGPIMPDQCKARVSKKGDKLVITLKKANQMEWAELRSKVHLPYRRGGGG
jgi:hypothetical protein